MAELKYKNAEIVSLNDLERGDIIAFISDPTKGTTQRGIIYSPVVNTQLGRTIGFRVLPVDTIGTMKKPAGRYPTYENDADSVVFQVGGNPAEQKIVVSFNLKSVANVAQMTGLSDKDKFRRVGSFHGAPIMEELLHEVKELYKKKALYIDDKPLKPEQVVPIVSPDAAKGDARDNSAARRGAYAAIEEANKNMGGTPVAEKLIEKLEERSKNPSLKEAYDGGYLNGWTIDVMEQLKMPGTQRTPKTLKDAYDIVTKHTDLITAVPGFKSRGVQYRELIEDVKDAAKSLLPPTADIK